MISEKHRNALAHALDDTKISSNTTPKDMIASLLLKPRNVIFFFNSDLLLEGKAQHRPLFIQVVMRAKKILCVMVDNGLVINVCLLRLLHKFGISVEELKSSNLIIRVYDDSKK